MDLNTSNCSKSTACHSPTGCPFPSQNGEFTHQSIQLGRLLPLPCSAREKPQQFLTASDHSCSFHPHSFHLDYRSNDCRIRMTAQEQLLWCTVNIYSSFSTVRSTLEPCVCAVKATCCSTALCPCAEPVCSAPRRFSTPGCQISKTGQDFVSLSSRIPPVCQVVCSAAELWQCPQDPGHDSLGL